MEEQIFEIVDYVHVETEGTDLYGSLASEDLPSFLKTRERLLTIHELLEKSK